MGIALALIAASLCIAIGVPTQMLLAQQISYWFWVAGFFPEKHSWAWLYLLVAVTAFALIAAGQGALAWFLLMRRESRREHP
ncbi:MAG: hypothetical protein JNG88_02080 [Phycisphaerales bacterium]|nr:hypothetical protein [Phycisphaerales bacterium]